MKVHHLNCATMCPLLGKRIINRLGRMVCHCLLVETSQGLILIDTGISVAEHEDPRRTLGRRFARATGLRSDPDQAAVRQIARLGLDPRDVRHIIVTHLDLDHAGGIPDFPGAKVHVYMPELEAARSRKSFRERERYQPRQWADADFVAHPADGQGDAWFGFQAVKPLPGLDIGLVPVVGHTRGHCAVAVKVNEGWLLHCGDAYFHAGETDPAGPHCSIGLRFFQRLMAMDNAARVANAARLVELRRDHGRDVKLFCAHDPNEYEDLAAVRPVRLFA